METKFGVYLDISEDNVLDIRNMPWFDLGDLPVSYNMTKTEAQQVFLIPESDKPASMVIKYDTWTGCYDNINAF